MAAPTDSTPVRNARVAARMATQALLLAQDNVGTTAATLAELQRTLAPDQTDLINAQQAAQTAVDAASTARANEKTARANLATAISNWVANVSLDDDLGRLSTSVPLLLFPVRIETRFGVDTATGNPVLRVRIYPDDIFVNLHEQAITQDEYNAGVAYYQARDAGGNEPELWRQIIQQMPAPRAAYILRLLTPTFGGGTSGTTTTTGTSSGGSMGPEFPTNIMFKPSDFSRPAEAILPDRWVVRTVSGTTKQDYPGNPIPEPLNMTPDPQAKDDSELFQVVGSNPPLLIDDELAWTVDYQRAFDVGMAVTIPLTAAQAAVGTGGFDKILVFGIKSSLDQYETTTLVEQLFDAHHYTRGLSLIQQGTPTNNTEDAPTTYPVPDPDGAISFAVERADPPTATTSSQQIPGVLGTDGNQLATILGVHNGLFQNVAGTAGGEQANATNMSTLLWPTTFGYVIEQLMSPLFSPTQHDLIRGYFINFVRARGPASAFLVGQVPYGVLPALSVVNWQKRGTTPLEGLEGLAQTTLLSLRELWKSSALTGVPTVTASSTDPLADLLKVLALYPSARELHIRHATGELTNIDLFNLFGLDYQVAANEAKSIVSDVLRRIAQPTWISAILSGMVFNDQANLVALPLVAPTPDLLSETNLIPPDFFNNLKNASPTDLINDAVTVPGQYKSTVFYKLARQALLWALVRASIAAAKESANANTFLFLELEVLFSASQAQPFAALVEQFGTTTAVTGDAQVEAAFGAFAALGSASTSELDRLLSETLDLASHRLDAWLTAFATRRLTETRFVQLLSPATLAPVGNYLGGYALVENVRPVARTTSTLTGYGTVETQQGNGGYVQAPSLTHATAAAILRNGYLSYRDEDPQKYAFDLSSARVRAARQVFEELRAGQPLGAVFGYLFERGLQSYPLNLNLNNYRYALRNYFPLVANKAGGPGTVSTGQVAQVAARNVVDGLALWKAFQANTIPFTTATDLPRPTIVVNGNTVANPAYTAIVTEIGKLGDAVDGTADLNVSEGILQIIRGNVTNAAGNLDSLARGARPPDPQMGVSQRGGVPANHRVALVFSGANVPTSPGPGWPTTPTPRASAEPVLDSWAGTILGNPTVPQAQVTLDPIVDPSNPTAVTASSVTFSLADLGLRPLDLIAIARAPALSNAGSALDRRFAAAATAFLAQQSDTTHTVGQITYQPAQGVGSIPQVMEVARALGALFAGARALGSDDLVAAADAPDARTTTDQTNQDLLTDLGTFVKDTTTTVRGLVTTLSGTTGLSAALTSASAYFADAFPPPGATDATLAVSIAPSVAAELGRRADAADKAGATATATAEDLAAQLITQIRALFGNDFMVLPPFVPPNPAELDQTLGARDTLLGTGTNADPNAPQQLLQQAAQVYDGLGRFRTLNLYRGALNQPPLRLDVAQLPFTPGEIWIGRTFDSNHLPSPGRQSLLLYSLGTAPPEAMDTWQGIVIQDWVEVIPNVTEETGLAFHYDNPGAEAAQAVLVVPPSSTGNSWKSADVWATLSETLDLAKIRAVDLDLVGGLGQVLPAIFAPQNLPLATAQTGWFGQLFNLT